MIVALLGGTTVQPSKNLLTNYPQTNYGRWESSNIWFEGYFGNS
ncbi:hypothetical protein ADIAG_00091 [Paeniglutamicibacter gangotriensis Lz1y]|uniref:Uncharacterized protein n=1 Tax=Paeniglutamicibacter gangotriensis Lz1y TaxID=1276920 RepID=M7NNF4_9MICC|nr:hypothetical protein ADIAG_00091 [Paeniglutamicibacter gangotriensis Lz1y]